MTADDLTTTEAAAVLGLSPVSVRSALVRGSMVGVKRGRDWFVPMHEVRLYELVHLGRRSGRPKGSKNRRRTE